MLQNFFGISACEMNPQITEFGAAFGLIVIFCSRRYNKQVPFANKPELSVYGDGHFAVENIHEVKILSHGQI